MTLAPSSLYTDAILHHTSLDLIEWRYDGVLPLSSDRVIDACAHELPGGGWRLWTDVHVAVLRADGNRLTCDRNEAVDLDLRRTV
jgi:hypothetical protein